MKNSSQRKISFLVAFFGWGIFLSVRAQESVKPVWTRRFSDQSFPGEMLKNKVPDLTVGVRFYPPDLHIGYPDQSVAEPPQPLISISSVVVPANIYYCQSGFFCKKEWELEKTTHIPLRFRLGSLDYCNVLEGKQRPAPF